MSKDYPLSHYIFADWDIGFKDWSRRTRARITGKRSMGWMKNRIRLWMQAVPGDLALEVYYRASGSKRVHIAVTFAGRTSGDMGALVFRTFIHDDAARVYLDIVRYCKRSDMNRLFDTKYNRHTGTIGHAGEWKLWFKVR